MKNEKFKISFRRARPSVALRCTVALVTLAFCAVCTAVKIYTVTCFKRKMKNEKFKIPYSAVQDRQLLLDVLSLLSLLLSVLFALLSRFTPSPVLSEK